LCQGLQGAAIIVTTAKRDYYEVLGIPRGADERAIKDAFRTGALKYHPDRNKEPGAEERFKEIAEAYAVLSDPKKRAEYDSAGFAGVAGFSPEDLFRGADFQSIFSDFGFGLGGDIFDRFFRQPRAAPPHGDDIEIDAVVPLETIATGGDAKIHFKRLVTCADCGGTGAKKGTAPHACPGCGGTGQKTRERREHGIFFRQSATCPDCHGRGTVIDHPCPRCRGDGQEQQEESLVVKVPAGADDGLVLRVPGKGYASRQQGEAPGDLLIVVRAAPDERLQRDGADLWHLHEIDIADAVLGGEISVPTLGGSILVRVPPGTQHNAQLRLRGKGLPRYGASGHGDLYVRMALKVPARLSSEERRLWEKLRELRHTPATRDP